MSDKFRLSLCPNKKYAVIVIAPSSARISPNRAMPLIRKSPQLMIILPNKAIVILITAPGEKRSRKKKYVPKKQRKAVMVKVKTDLPTNYKLGNSTKEKN